MINRTTIQVSEDLRKELRILAARRDVSYQEILQDMISVFKELNQEKTIVSIPSKLANKVDSNLKNTDMSSVSEYVTFLLRTVFSEKSDKTVKFDEKRIKQKLKRLGYL